MIGATAAEDGAAGLVPPPEKGDRDRYLRSDGIWTSADGGDADTVGGKTADELLDTVTRPTHRPSPHPSQQTGEMLTLWMAVTLTILPGQMLSGSQKI